MIVYFNLPYLCLRVWEKNLEGQNLPESTIENEVKSYKTAIFS